MMKTLTTLVLIFTIATSYAGESLTRLDMELGYWETTTAIEQSDAIKKMLASIPDAQREQMRKSMESAENIPVSKECITKKSFENMEERLKKAFSGNQDECKFSITKSTNKEFIGALNCAGGSTSSVSTKVISSKHHESRVVSSVPGLGETKVITTGKWKSATCPKGV